jgi:hypothetical protein
MIVLVGDFVGMAAAVSVLEGINREASGALLQTIRSDCGAGL